MLADLTKHRVSATALALTGFFMLSGHADAATIDDFTDTQAWSTSSNGTKILSPVPGSLFDTRELSVSPNVGTFANSEFIDIGSGSATFGESGSVPIDFKIAYSKNTGIDLSGASNFGFDVFSNQTLAGLEFSVLLGDSSLQETQTFQVNQQKLIVELSGFTAVDLSNVNNFSISTSSLNDLELSAITTSVSTTANIPVPASMSLLAIGLIGLGVFGRRGRAA